MPPRTGQFAEGLTVLPDDRLLQLTYRENQLNIYRTAPSLEFVRTTGVTLGDHSQPPTYQWRVTGLFLHPAHDRRNMKRMERKLRDGQFQLQTFHGCVVCASKSR